MTDINHSPGEGGYLIPEVIEVKRPGILGCFYRLIGSKRGYEEFRLYEHILAMRNCFIRRTVETEILNINGEHND